ncbi:MAG: DUF1427 family protein [Cyanobacteria bacterium CRU_2_1]|nr:DUF1427 family protein [Cyanobacteria bacterium CRU_2_1]
MRQLILSLFVGWIIGVVFSWFKLPLPVPPLAGLFGLAGMMLGDWMLQQLHQFLQSVD